MNPDHTHFPALQPLWPALKDRGGERKGKRKRRKRKRKNQVHCQTLGDQTLKENWVFPTHTTPEPSVLDSYPSVSILHTTVSFHILSVSWFLTLFPWEGRDKYGLKTFKASGKQARIPKAWEGPHWPALDQVVLPPVGFSFKQGWVSERLPQASDPPGLFACPGYKQLLVPVRNPPEVSVAL